MNAMVLVREITADDWQLMRDVRLAALAEAPHAFASTYAREVAFGEPQWRGRINDRSVNYYAQAAPDQEPAGLAGVFVADGAADLVSMWVRPGCRGQGIGEALVAAAAAWARARGFATLFLWVTESNTAAMRLYERCGFAVTGELQPLPWDPAVTEIQMSRAL
jgi:ribosomal protein S18 acetylase RimI-like enzyme